MRMSEGQEQAVLFEWATAMRRKYPSLALLHHIPNGGKRDARTAAILKRQGVKAGVPDLCLPVAKGDYHGLYIELKTAAGKTSDSQDGWIRELRLQGYAAVVCRGWQDAAAVILDYLDGGVIREQSLW